MLADCVWLPQQMCSSQICCSSHTQSAYLPQLGDSQSPIRMKKSCEDVLMQCSQMTTPKSRMPDEAAMQCGQSEHAEQPTF